MNGEWKEGPRKEMEGENRSRNSDGYWEGVEALRFRALADREDDLEEEKGKEEFTVYPSNAAEFKYVILIQDRLFNFLHFDCYWGHHWNTEVAKGEERLMRSPLRDLREQNIKILVKEV